ncbi:MAG TPA: recombinase family protein [Candidatus Paceibacterota bacterium]
MDKVVYYARVSTKAEEQQSALKDQIIELENYIEEQGEWELVDKYVDLGKSGTSAKSRKQYLRLYQDLEEEEKFDIIVIKDETRLNRNTFDWYTFLNRLINNGKKLYFYMDRKFYTPDDKFLIGVRALIAEQYSKDLSIKINNAHKQRQNRGLVCANTRLLGYDLKKGKLVINEEQAEIIRELYRLYISKMGFRTIATLFASKGINNTVGTTYNETTLKRMISNEKYKGTLVGNKKHLDFETKKIIDMPKEKWIITEDCIPAIVSKEDWQKANDLLEERRQHVFMRDGVMRVIGLKQNTYLYSRKIICEECGATFAHVKRKNCNNNVWQCNNNRKSQKICPSNLKLKDAQLDSLMKAVIEKFWENKDITLKSSLAFLDATLEDDGSIEIIAKCTMEKTKIEKMKSKLIDLLTQDLVSKTDYIEKKQEFDNKIQELNEKIKDAEQLSKTIKNKKIRINEIETWMSKWETDNIIINDEVIDYFLDKIVVKKDKKIDIYLSGNTKCTVDLNDCDLDVVSTYK